MLKKYLMVSFGLLLIMLTGCNKSVYNGSLNVRCIGDHGLTNASSGELITNVKELNNSHMKKYIVSDSTKEFNTAFFETTAIITFSIVAGSGGNEYEIKSWKVSQDVMTIQVSLVQAGMTCDVKNNIFIVEIPKTDLKDASEVKVLLDGKELPKLYNLDIIDSGLLRYDFFSESFHSAGEKVSFSTRQFKNIEVIPYLNGEKFDFEVREENSSYGNTSIYTFKMPAHDVTISFKTIPNEYIPYPREYYMLNINASLILRNQEELFNSNIYARVCKTSEVYYTEDYFKDNALVAFPIKIIDRTSIYTIDRYEVEKDTIKIYIKSISTNNELSSDYKYITGVINVSKSHIDKVNNIEVYLNGAILN